MACTCSSLIVKWIYLSLRLHWVVTIPQFDLYISRVPKWHSSISVLERSLLALDFVSTFTQEYTVLDCNVIFSPLSESVRSDQIYSMAVAIADQKALPSMNLEYFHRNLEWNYLAQPKLLDLPSGDELDILEQQL